ncbi:MAG TPA: hypothetical protein VGP90_05345 [Acidimicrobiia bacterium]|nr:hypothetical protein [Acidimicrobiia bacterium]
MAIGIRTGGVVMAVALLVGGCGGGGKKSDTAGSTATTAPSTGTGGATVTTGTPGGGPGDCGVHEKNGIQTRTFCGQASATLSVNNQDVTFPAGECETTADYVSVNIGTIVLGTGDKATALKATTAYFGMNIGRTPSDDASKPAADKDGTFTASFAGNDHGRAITVVTGSVVLTSNRTKGTMSGTTLTKEPVTGRFSCG